MPWEYVPYVLPLLIAAAVSAALALYAWRRHRMSGAAPFALTMLSVAVWSLGYALELASTDLPAALFWNRIQYLGVVTMPAAWLAFVLQHTGRGAWLTRRNLALLAIVPLVTLLLAWTNDVHNLIWRDPWLNAGGPFTVMSFTRGLWYWVNVAYAYLLLLPATILLIQALVRGPHLYRQQAVVLLVGALAPWVGNVLYMSELTPFPHLDLTPFAFTISGLAMAWGLFRVRLLDIVPVARDAVVGGMSDSVIVVDTQNRVADLNPAAERVVGHTASEAVGQPMEQLFSGWPGLVECCLDTLEVQTEIAVGEGEAQRTYDLRISPLRDRRARLTGRLVLLRDVTERVRATEGQRQALAEALLATRALRESEDKYRTLVAQISIGVITCDREGNITHANPALLEILGSPSEEATRRFNLLTSPGLVEAGIAADFRRCIEEATPITAEYFYRSYWGKESILRARMTCLREEGGGVGGALATVEDVTEQRRLEEQLIQSAKLASIGQLAAGVAHEINNPINGIINYAQLLLNQAEPGSRQAHFLQGIQREGDRVVGIVRDLLTFARAEKEAHSPAHVPDILRATLTLTGQLLKKDGIILEVEEQPDLPRIKCRSQRIQQVFLNLISNARHALNARYPDGYPEKRLTISIEEVEREGRLYVRTTFCDWGIGIPEQDLPRIFDPFFTTKRPGEGAGLGLSVSYGIVQDHHGDIQVESVEGERTIFRVDLPVDNGWEL